MSTFPVPTRCGRCTGQRHYHRGSLIVVCAGCDQTLSWWTYTVRVCPHPTPCTPAHRRTNP